MKWYRNIFQLVLRILGTIALLCYILFLIGEIDLPINKVSFADISVYILFLFFLVGYYFLWKRETLSGLLFLIWYILEWILVFHVWIDGALTLILGFPIAVIGVLLLVYGIKNKIPIF